MWLPHAKTTFYYYVVRFRISHYNNISMKLDIGKKITGLEIMTWNCKKSSMFPNL